MDQSPVREKHVAKISVIFTYRTRSTLDISKICFSWLSIQLRFIWKKCLLPSHFICIWTFIRFPVFFIIFNQNLYPFKFNYVIVFSAKESRFFLNVSCYTVDFNFPVRNSRLRSAWITFASKKWKLHFVIQTQTQTCLEPYND